MQTLHRLSKWLGFLALGSYVFLAVAFLVLRYWVAPNIDQWREPLQRELSSMLSMPVQLGEIQADWHWRGPRIVLQDAQLQDDSGRTLLEIPSLDVALAWPDLIRGNARFLNLRADGVELLVQREASGRITMLGYELEDDDEGDGVDTIHDFEIVHWLLQQGNVRLTNAHVRWLDESRDAPPLDFTDVTLGFTAQGGELLFSMRARPPQELGQSFTLQGRLLPGSMKGLAMSMDDVNGLFHVDVDGMQPASWKPWFDVHSSLEQGEVRWQGWQEVAGGAPGHHASIITVTNGTWKAVDAAQVHADSAQLYLAGPWEALQTLWEDTAEGSSGTVRVALHAQGVGVEASEYFVSPLQFDAVAFSADVNRDAPSGLRLNADRLQLRNADMDLDVNGQWQQRGAGEAGLIDLEGRFRRAELAAIVHYLPLEVDEEAREWMQHGLLAGRLTDAPLRLQGDLVHFPFGDYPDKGDFELGGPVHDVVIDYAPAALVGPPGWPRLERLHGHARLHRVDLQIHADTMQMRPNDLPIDFTDVDARIANIEEDSVLEVHGVGRAPAAAVLALVKISPLGELLDKAFDMAHGEGQWEVPLSLTIPLADTDDMQVEGAVVFDDASLRLAETVPAFSALSGRINFTESVMIAQGLKARALGGPVTISGGIGAGQRGLAFQGRFTAQALQSLVGSSIDGLLEGAAAYRLTVHRSVNGAYDLEFESPLEGLALKLPQPLGKAPATRYPLHARWSDARKGEATLDIRVGDDLAAQFVHREGQKSNSFFRSGVVNLKGSAKRPDTGLAVDVSIPRIDLDAWQGLAESFEGDGASGQRVLPAMTSVRLQSEAATFFGATLDQLTFTMKQAEGQRWRVDVSSTQTAGTLFWRERQGRIQGDVEAKFERLALGTADTGPSDTAPSAPSDADDATLAPDTDVNIPAIRLSVDRLRLYGRDVGALSLVGVNEAQGRRWNLKQLELKSPHGAVQGHGLWRLDGAQRGLRLEADAQFSDLGAWLAHAGFKDLMQGGKGSVQGHIEWRGIPWRFDRDQLGGELDVDLVDGRFISLGSRSARLLELLSLQSVKRLASLDWNPGGLMKQGFPFDSVDGRLTMTDGIIHSENYRVSGPVGTIVIAGDVALPDERLDLYAVVVPTLDVSGAAIAAGIAVNPIVGLGAFLTQWLLKSPLSKAMAVEYRVKGGFDAPKVEEISTRAASSTSSEPVPR